MSNQFMFADEASQQNTKLPTEYWKILIVDDEPEVHAVTKLALNDFNFLGRGLKFYSAFSGEEAKKTYRRASRCGNSLAGRCYGNR